MKTRAGFALIALLLAAPSLVQAQNQPAPDPAKKEEGFGKKAMGIFTKQPHLIVKSVAPGGGFGPGIGYKTRGKLQERLFIGGEAVVTWRKYWNTQANAVFQGDWLHAEAYGRARKMTRLDFYGIGEDTTTDNRTTFSYNDRTVGGVASVRFPPFDVLAVGGRVEGIWPQIGEGRNRNFPSIEERFADAQAPGLLEQPNYMAYTGFVNLNFPGGNQLGRYGGDFQVAYSAYRDQDNQPFDFDRVNIEFQQRIPSIRPSHKLTLHQLFSTSRTSAGNRVPFYLQQTLGGNGAVRSFNEDILGSDATKATLRGFRDLRFRGPHLLLLQAEYRFTIKGPVDATIFGDAGKVTAQRGDLDLSNLKTDYGFSVSLMTSVATAVRVDVGFGGGEGTRIFFSIGPIFQQQ